LGLKREWSYNNWRLRLQAGLILPFLFGNTSGTMSSAINLTKKLGKKSAIRNEGKPINGN